MIFYTQKSTGLLLIVLLFVLPLLSSCITEPALTTLPYTGMAFGKVTDEKGNAIQGVKVFSPGTNLQYFTNSKGQFTLIKLPLGKTLIVVEHSGYQSITTFIEVTGDAAIKDLDFVLKNYIYEVVAEQIGTGDVQIRWRTTVDANERLLWGTSDAYGNKILSDKFTKVHSQVIYGVEIDTEYHYKIHARDLRGFEYETKDMTFKISEADLPAAVTITQGTATGTTVKLEWTQSSEEEFAYYQIYRNTEPPVLIGGHYVVGITDPTVLSFTDGGLVEDTNYFYQVLVYDKGGLYSKSNEYQIKTLNPAPDPVSLDPPYEITNSSMKLSWTGSSATDFFSYQVYKSQTEPMPPGAELIAEFKNPATMNLLATPLNENQKYYFKVTVVDISGQKADSNTVGAYTQNYPPPLLYLGYNPDELRPDSVLLGWTDPNISDFKKIDIYRGTDSPVTDINTLVSSITYSDTLSYKDTGLSPETGYFYRIYLYDQTDFYTASNELHFTTPAVVPNPFNGGVIDRITYMIASNSPYQINGDMVINQAATLIIEPGVEVKIAANLDNSNGGEDNSRVEIVVNGSFKSEGNQMSRIKFRSDSAAPTSTDWYGIIFKNGATGSSAVFEFIDVDHAMYGCYINNYTVHPKYCNFTRNDIGLFVENDSTPVIQECYFTESSQNGIRCEKSSIMIRTSEIKGNPEGIFLSDSSSPLIIQCNINLNINNGIFCQNGSNPFVQSNNIMTNGAWAVNGGGILGSQGSQNGNYIKANNGLTTVDSTVAGVQDGYLNTTTPQCNNVDAINAAATSPVQ